MTTKVIVLCPDNSIHDVLIRVVKEEVMVQEIIVPPHEQSDPVYLDERTRLLISEVEPQAEEKASIQAGPK